MKRILILLIFIAISSCSDEPSGTIEFNCDTDNPSPKGNRKLGIDILDMAQNETFDRNLELANELGADFTAVHINWNDIEPQKELYQDPFDIFSSFSQVLPPNDMKLSLTIRPIDATGKYVPDDLMNTPFADSVFIDRFLKMLDYVFDNIDADLLQNLIIGNEVDLYNTENEIGTFWSDYSSLLYAVNQYLEEKHPDLMMGFTITGKEALRQRFNTRRMLDSSDFLGITYYGLDDNFYVKGRVDWLIDLTDIISAYEGKKISFQELGMPTSDANFSDEMSQAELFCNFFKLWDLNSEQILSCNIVRMNDLSLEKAQELAEPYGQDSEVFIEYLRTLGIRTYDGENKSAFEMLKDLSAARNW